MLPILAWGYPAEVNLLVDASNPAARYTPRHGDLNRTSGRVPRPATLIQAIAAFQAGKLSRALLDDEYATALRDTIERFQRTGSPVISDGEQTKPSFATYPLSGLTNLAPDGVMIPFADGHVRQLPRLTSWPFRYGVHAVSYLEAARRYTHLPVKQAVISASALSLLYPSTEDSGLSARGIPGQPDRRSRGRYSRSPRCGRSQCPDRLHRSPVVT